MATQLNPDSRLQHSFGAGELGLDYYPVAMTPGGALEVPPPVPTLDLSHSGPLPEFEPAVLPAPPPSPPPPKPTSRSGVAAPAQLWLDGDVLMCGCPDCRAPLSVRVWLMAAECWRCGTAIELSEEQEREAQRLLAQREAATRRPPAPPEPRPAAVANRPAAPAEPKPAAPQPSEPKPPELKPAEAKAAEPKPVEARPAAPKPPPESRAAPAERAAPAPAAPAPSPAADRRTVAPAEPAAAPQAPAAPPPSAPAGPGSRFRGLPRSAPGEAAAGEPAGPSVQPAPRPRRRAATLRRPPQNNWVRDLIRDTPAWLISMLVHLVAITLLALLSVPEQEKGEPYITLTMSTSRKQNDGGETVPVKITNDARFDMPLPAKVNLKNDKELQALLAANQDARDLRLDDENAPPLPDVALLKAQISQREGVRSNLVARDPRLRAELVTKEGGTTLTEAAVARGLRWLANHQFEDGSWSLNSFHQAGDCNCGGRGAYGKGPGTALAMLPFLGAGQTHFVGKYKGTVSRGLRWLIANQKPDGDLRAGANDNSGMYTHGQATIVLCEAFAVSGDEELRIPAQRAVDFVVRAQYRDGGWRYQPGPPTQRGDTSVVGWQLMALQSARAANLTVPEETLGLANLYFDSVQQRDGSQYGYQARHPATPTMTAEALLCRMYLGWTKQQPGLVKGVEYLASSHLPVANRPNIYYWYYGTQTMHHYGGREWEAWNERMRDILTGSQETQGHVAGSWSPQGDHASAGGRIYMTSLSVCTLEVYYRHLPIFRQIDLER